MARIRWLGHAAFLVRARDKSILFDPWITGNPLSPLEGEGDIDDVDAVLVSHDHRDHGFGDAVEICKRTGATFVGVHELAVKAMELGVENAVGGNLGGTVTAGGVEIFFTLAYHSCDIGTPCGFLAKMPGLSVYHAGDTAYYKDMELLPKIAPIDVAFLPIGSTYTMGPREASWAVGSLQPKIAIPIHYGTFPPVEQDPMKFKELVGEKARVEILKVGGELVI